MHDLCHRHLIVTAFLNNAPTNVETGEDWLTKLVEVVDMQILMDAKAIYCEDLGNEGLTGVVGLTTSHASFHAWHAVERPFMQMDLYSCRDFTVADVLEHMKVFEPTEVSFVVLDRNDGINKVVEQGVVRFS